MGIKEDAERMARRLDSIPEQIREMSGVPGDIRKAMETKRIGGKLYRRLRSKEKVDRGDVYFVDGKPVPSSARGYEINVPGDIYYRPIEEKPETVTIEISRETAEYISGDRWSGDAMNEASRACRKALQPKAPSKDILEYPAKLDTEEIAELAEWVLHVLENGYKQESTDE